jgi:hypothetical protein
MLTMGDENGATRNRDEPTFQHKALAIGPGIAERGTVQ